MTLPWRPLERVLITLWVGGLWVTGFVVAPALFRVAETPAVAGRFAGEVFSTMNGVGIAAALALLAVFALSGMFRTRRLCAVLVGAMLALTLAGEFGLTPAMEALRDAGGGAPAPGTAEHARFGLLHGVASVLFLLTSLLGLALVLVAGRER